jgi:hypothetical protein
MAEPHAFSSLTPRLLARKGGASPAMRRQDSPRLVVGHPARPQLDDLGWNDWGHPEGHEAEKAPELTDREMPEVLRQIERLAWQINQSVVPGQPATSAAEGRRAAFTLRLDAERHFRLRMAGVVLNRSAQVLVTEALDKYLSEIPEVSHLRSAAGEQS